VTDESWNMAHLVPGWGIDRLQVQGHRATAAVLVALVSVKEFGRANTQRMTTPAGIKLDLTRSSKF
jgi:hypothetical protein